ncbi:cation-translocating P-type ATPase [Mangrovimicrobium sediminis]|uniref:cation-translocating P-type ATPase n=1 Tax=Mangrovimicrobium sediminis TaxID=2562682 RepID=UPI001F107A68|nr:HAD-IC family P-type ATPase [Haliea sp. SAOS-164]
MTNDSPTPPATADSVPAYSISGEAVLESLASSRDGLGQAVIAERQARFGPNELTFSRTPAWVIFLRQFRDPMVIILLITACVTGGLTIAGSHMLPDTLVIVGVVILNAILGFVQEGKAEGAMDALRNMMVQECLVVREGCQAKLPARELVPGDIVVLEGGDRIPADVRFIEASNVHVDESSLTGESVPVEKRTAPVEGSDLVPGDQRNMGFSGTFLTRGSALAVVVETGASTVFGHMADLVQSADAGPTPLQRQMQSFVRALIGIILVVGVINFGFGIYLGYAASYSFLGAVSLVVAAIPEMLPALVTSILALSSIAMARRNALVRKLPAAETLGATSVICSDKTGTLTENRMTVTRVFAGGEEFEVSGGGGALSGQFLRDGAALDPRAAPALYNNLYAGYACNNASLTSGSTAHTGDPTEIALKVSGAKADITAEGLHRLEEIPFDSATKYMAILVRDGDAHRVLVKGAPEVVVAMCSTQLDASGESQPLDAQQALSVAGSFAKQALRTLAVAWLPVSDTCRDLTHDDLHDLQFLGLQGMIDPPKQSAIEAVAQCSAAGIRTVMITGDHPETAQAVAAKLGIPAERAVTGAELTRLDEDELFELTRQVSVFARVAPEHKEQIAQSLRRHGLIVAMTGDGVNDAPALKVADIGIAMGQAGTEVAKEASDMVLVDDNFATIVAAVEEGRHAWKNLRKAILYTLPTNAAQALLIIGAVMVAAWVPLFSHRFVLEPVQILWINLLDSVLLTMPLVMEPKERGLLQDPPRGPKERLMDGLFLRRLVIMGLAISVPGFLLYYHLGAAGVVGDQVVDELLLTQAQTAAFWGILMAHFGYVVSARSVETSVFRLNPFSNPWLIGGIVLSVAIRFIPTFIPEAASLFRTASFPSEWWPLILACFLPSFIAIELDKLFSRRHRHHHPRPAPG